MVVAVVWVEGIFALVGAVAAIWFACWLVLKLLDAVVARRGPVYAIRRYAIYREFDAAGYAILDAHVGRDSWWDTTGGMLTDADRAEMFATGRRIMAAFNVFSEGEWANVSGDDSTLVVA